MFQTYNLKVIGETSQNKSRQASNTLTKGWYPELTPSGRSQAILLPWPGLKAFGTSPKTPHRGRHVFNDVLYQVVGDTLYSIDSSGTYTSIGTIDGFTRCIFDNNGDFMVIVSDGNVYSYDGTTLTKATDIDFESPDSVGMLNNQFLYDGTGDRFVVSDPGAPLTIQGLNYASAESKGDPLLRCFPFKQWVYMMGTSTIEPWYNSGVGNPPFDRIDNGIMEKGLGALHTVDNTDQFMYFLGDDSNVYQIIQTQVRNISPPAIAYQLGKLDKTNAVGTCVQIDGQDFYILSFGVDELVYVYSEQTQSWFNLSSGTDNGRYRAVDLVEVYGTVIGFDYSTANAIELDEDTHTDLGDVIQRRRVLPQLNSSVLGLGAGKRLLMDSAKFIVETGVGLASGQGSDPKIMVEFSENGGATWSTARWIEIGKMGEFLINVEMWEMVSFYDITFRLTISDPVFSSLHDGSINVKLDGY